MPVVATFAVAAVVVWAVVYAVRGSLTTASLAVLVSAYACGHWFWSVDLGPIPLTLDRLLLVGLVVMYACQWRLGKLDPKPLVGIDLLLICLLATVTVSALLHQPPQVEEGNPSPFWRLVASFWIPAVLYWMVRQSRWDFSTWRNLMVGLAVLGAYLTLTAFAEATQQWWAVIPRYIHNPDLGTHFGRARGPMLNSASLGILLTVCIWSTWSLRGHVPRAFSLLLIATLPWMAMAVYLTYTRSTWLGLAISSVFVLWLTLPHAWRLPVVSSATVAGLVLAVVAWGHLVDLRREGSVGDSQHSVHQRLSFAYVSWQMFQDHPVFGVGFGRFYDKKLPYLADRSQNLELESLRPLHHHNTLLSLLTETGMVGLFGVAASFVALARRSWSLARAREAPSWMRSQGLLMLSVLLAYVPNAVFHDVTLLHTEIWVLAIMAGATVGLTVATSPAQGRVAATSQIGRTWQWAAP